MNTTAPSPPPPARIIALATALPPYIIDQTDAETGAARIFSERPRHFEVMSKVFVNSGIDTRHSVVPIEWYYETHGWAEKNRIYLEESLNLIEAASRRCLADAALEPKDIDSVVVVSSSGIATPALDARLLNRIGLKPSIRRLPIFGLGCAGGVLGLARSAMVARDRPGSRVLMVVVELCGITFRRGDMSKSNIIATALFGDGAAAAIISTEGEGPAILDSHEHTWPDSLDVMGWDVADDGLKVLFSRDIPTLVRDDLSVVVEQFLADQGLTASDIDGVVCHPGGAKVLTAMESAFNRPSESFDVARRTLRGHGNMSAATVLFVLRAALDQGLAGRQLLSALGPGFTAALLLLSIDRPAQAA